MDSSRGDAELLERAGRGDAAAWGGLLERHGPFVLGVAVRRLKRAGFGRPEAEEVVQELWIALLRGGARAARLEGGLRPYLAAAVLNQARTWLKGRARAAARDLARPLQPEGAAEDPLLQRESIERLNVALEGLEAKARLLLRWAYWDGLRYEEIGRLLGISPNGVGPLLSQAREGLKKRLESGETGHGPDAPRRHLP